MGREEHDAHEQANAEQIAQLKAELGLLAPWDEADDDAPLADLRPGTPDDAPGGRLSSAVQGRPCTGQTSADASPA